jgi:nucleoside 2-deoxyribosyltransferase
MLIYLAARYSRRLELCEYRDEIRALGHDVQAVWLDGAHQIDREGKPIGDSGESLVEGEGDSGEQSERATALRIKFASEDYNDVRNCETLIAFTEPPRSNASRGGRHVELGLALGMGKRVWIVGYRENIFCWLPDVRFFETWEDCRTYLKQP